MTEANFQLVLTSLTAIIVAITGSITAYFGYRNHLTGQANSDKIDTLVTPPKP